MRRHAFTLVELLVVVAIIVALLAILLPSMNKAIAAAQLSVCLSNQRQINQAAIGYVQDHLGEYPSYPTWTTLIGKRGTSTAYSSSSYGPESRPLNAYTSNAVEIARCPSDLGDSHTAWGNSITNCYEQYGNSYVSPWYSDVYRAAYVVGVPGSTRAKRISSFSSMANKVVVGDFVWWLNRYWSNPRTRWHSTSPIRTIPIAFADGNASVIVVPAVHEPEGTLPPNNNFPPHPSFVYW